MQINMITLMLTLAVSSIVTGCSNSEQPQEPKTPAIPHKMSSGKVSTKRVAESKVVTFDDLPNSAVLIAVNGKELTKATFLAWVDLRKKLLSSSLPNAGRGNDPTRIIKEQMLASVTNDYVGQIVAIDYAKAFGIVAGTNQIETCRKAFMRVARINDGTWDRALRKFSAAQRDTINDRIAVEATVAAVSDYFFKTNSVEVEQREIDALYANYVKYNKDCAMTNVSTWAQASNIWNRIQSGESFEELARKFDEDEYREDDGVWGDFCITDFTNEPEIWKLTPRFRPGWVSPPVEADNGITILKINSIIDGDANVNAVDYVPSPSAEMNISRIFIHLPLFIESASKEQFAAECQRAKKISSFNRFLNDLVSKADIKYPCGTEIFGAKENEGQSSMIR